MAEIQIADIQAKVQSEESEYNELTAGQEELNKIISKIEWYSEHIVMKHGVGSAADWNQAREYFEAQRARMQGFIHDKGVRVDALKDLVESMNIVRSAPVVTQATPKGEVKFDIQMNHPTERAQEEHAEAQQQPQQKAQPQKPRPVPSSLIATEVQNIPPRK